MRGCVPTREKHGRPATTAAPPAHRHHTNNHLSHRPNACSPFRAVVKYCIICSVPSVSVHDHCFDPSTKNRNLNIVLLIYFHCANAPDADLDVTIVGWVLSSACRDNRDLLGVALVLNRRWSAISSTDKLRMFHFSL